jgi:hypothetical protein
MAITLNADEQGQTICTLEGVLLDQGALVGVLNTLYELHLPVLMVNCLSWPEENLDKGNSASTRG